VIETLDPKPFILLSRVLWWGKVNRRLGLFEYSLAKNPLRVNNDFSDAVYLTHNTGFSKALIANLLPGAISILLLFVRRGSVSGGRGCI